MLKTCLTFAKDTEIAEIIEKNPFKLLTLRAAETIFPAFQKTQVVADPARRCELLKKRDRYRPATGCVILPRAKMIVWLTRRVCACKIRSGVAGSRGLPASLHESQ